MSFTFYCIFLFILTKMIKFSLKVGVADGMEEGTVFIERRLDPYIAYLSSRARWFLQSLRDTKPGASVTETNILSYIGGYEVVSHTPHEHHHSDRIFRQRPKWDFSSFLSFFSWQRLPYMIKPFKKKREKRGKVSFWPLSKNSVTMVVFVGGMGDHLIPSHRA